MRSRAAAQIEAPGQDSFLDVVCNLVGILIILVMLVAAQAKGSMMAAATAEVAPEKDELADQAKQATSAALAIETSVHELQAKIEREKLELAAREQERNQYQVLVTVAEEKLAEHRQKLTEEERARYDLEQQLTHSRGELARLDAQRSTLTRPAPIVLEHLPTPMARTVFGTEIHFRLQGGRLAYVPWDEMIERMKIDARDHVAKLREVPRAEFSLPVIHGFGARYILRRADLLIETRAGRATQSGVELEKIYFVDAESNLGQPVSQALETGSELRSRLAVMRPETTTVTIWVYPDGFDDFRALKAGLFKLGFLTAARPLPDGQPIGGAPDGSRSAAQ